MSRVALGFKARTGRAILVMLAGDALDARDARVIEHSEVALLPEGDFAPYHAAAGIEPSTAREHAGWN
jgi:hypothetical protein